MILAVILAIVSGCKTFEAQRLARDISARSGDARVHVTLKRKKLTSGNKRHWKFCVDSLLYNRFN